MQLMIPHLDKTRIVLNKADSISTQQLMRVYGALMWQLGKVMNTPETCRVYMGSFWDAPLQNTEQAELLQREEMDLLHDVMNLPQQAVMRRITACWGKFITSWSKSISSRCNSSACSVFCSGASQKLPM